MTDLYDGMIRGASEAYKVPFDWIKAIIGTESGFNPTAYRAEPAINDASYGLMQLLYSTARWMGFAGEPEQLFNPAVNIDIGTKYLAYLIGRYGGDSFERIYSAYNSGSPDKYTTSSQVAAHVRNALDWLRRVQAEIVSPGSGANTVVVIAMIALLFLWRK